MTVVQRIAVLGATGSIGRSTLDVVARHPDRFRIHALTAHRNIDALYEACRVHRPAVAVVADAAGARALSARFEADGIDIAVLSGEQGLVEAVTHPDVDSVMAAIVGAAGLKPTIAAASAGKKILLANKEALVMAGPIFMAA